jgi:hypothetical protein
MKKIVGVLFFLALFLNDGLAQKELNLRAKYKPETVYNQTIEQRSQTELLYSGSDDFMKKLKDQGIANPTVSTQQSKFVAVVKTEKLKNDGFFPLNIEFVSSTTSEGKKIIPDGTIIYGHSTTKSMPTLDSIVSKEMKDSIKQSSLQGMQALISQISFPEDKLLKIGDVFSVETPLSMPLSGMSLNMDITTFYKLTSIKKGIGYLDITQVLNMKTVLSGVDVTASGTGTGIMEYDMKKDFYRKYQVDMDVLMGMKNAMFNLDLKIKSTIIQTVDIAKRKK